MYVLYALARRGPALNAPPAARPTEPTAKRYCNTVKPARNRGLNTRLPWVVFN